MKKEKSYGKTGEQSILKIVKSGEKHIINDILTGSKAFVPVQMDAGYEAEIVQVDGKLITGLPDGRHVCDSLVFSLDSEVQNIRITWLIELKGTKNEHEAKHAITQIEESIEYLNDSVRYPVATKYLKQRDYVFAAVAGAPDKTLPIMNNNDIKSLCKRLNALSGRRKQIKDMFMLFCYIKPNRNCNNALLHGDRPPYNIYCHSNKNGYISYPSMLLKLLKG